MNTNANPIEIGAADSAQPGPTTSASPSSAFSEISNLKSEISPESAIRNPHSAITLALAHAERSYPTSARPKSPSHAKLYDAEKQRCFQQRLAIETEIQQQRVAAISPVPPVPPASAVPPSHSQLSHPSAEPSASIASAESAACAGSMQNQPVTSAVDAPSLRREPAAHAPTAQPASAASNQPGCGEAAKKPMGSSVQFSKQATVFSPSLPRGAGGEGRGEEVSSVCLASPAEPPSSTTDLSRHEVPAEAPSSPNLPSNPSISQNPHANDPVFHYMMETNGHFRERHQLLEKIRAKLTSSASDPANSAGSGTPSASEESQPSSPIHEFLDPRSPLDQLSPERRRLLFEAIDEFNPGDVAALISKPEPQGWGLNTSERSLRRFWNRYRSQIHSHKSAETQQLARDLLANPDLPGADLDLATDRLFKTRLFRSLNDPKQPAREIDHLLRAYTRLRAIELAERKRAAAPENARAATGGPS